MDKINDELHSGHIVQKEFLNSPIKKSFEKNRSLIIPNLHFFMIFRPQCGLSVCCCLAPNSKILAKLQDISFRYDFLCPILHVIHNRLLAMTFWLLKKVLKVATLGIGKMPKESESIIILHTTATLLRSHTEFKFQSFFPGGCSVVNFDIFVIGISYLISITYQYMKNKIRAFQFPIHILFESFYIRNNFD